MAMTGVRASGVMGFLFGLAFLSLLMLGCGDGGPGPTAWREEQSWTSTHFVYHARPDDPSVGPEVLEILERHASQIGAAQIGADLGAWAPLHYFKYRDLADLVAAGSPCGDRPCTLLFESGRKEIHTPSPIDQHELTHGYAFALGCAAPLFREGLAVSMSCDPGVEDLLDSGVSTPPWLGRSWRDLTSFDGPHPTSYLPAGLLTTAIIDRWGMPAFRAFYRQASCGASADQIAAAFAAQFGTSLDQAWTEVASAPRARACQLAWGCADASGSGALTLTNDPGAYRLAVPLPAAGAIAVASHQPSAAPPVIRACDAASALPPFHDFWPRYPVAFAPVVLLPGASNVVAALRNPAGTGDQPIVRVNLSLTPIDHAPASSACTQAPSIVVGDTSASLLLWPAATPAIVQLGSSLAAVTQTARIDQDGGAEASVEVCAACVDGALQDCTTNLRATDAFNAPWVRVGWAPAVARPLTLSIQWL